MAHNGKCRCKLLIAIGSKIQNSHCDAHCARMLSNWPIKDPANHRPFPFYMMAIEYRSIACSSSKSLKRRLNQWFDLRSLQSNHPWCQDSPCSELAFEEREYLCVFTLGMTLSRLPWLYSDLETAVSILWITLGSSFCEWFRSLTLRSCYHLAGDLQKRSWWSNRSPLSQHSSALWTSRTLLEASQVYCCRLVFSGSSWPYHPCLALPCADAALEPPETCR